MNIAFSCYIQVNDLEKCLEILIESGQLPEACLFCRTYLPSKLTTTLEHWNSKLNDSNSNNRLSKLLLLILNVRYKSN
jgi:coatomer subunit beta'